MGIAIAEELARRGAEVQLVLGPTSYTTNAPGIRLQRVQTAEEMYEACIACWSSATLAVMSAAVADYSPSGRSAEKIKKTENTFTLELSKTKDILASLGERKHNGQVLVGFALENRNEKEYAQSKLKKKNADIIVLNSLNDEGAGFGFDTNKVTIFEKDGNEIPYDRKPKKEVARDIVDRIVKMLYA